MAKKKMTPLEFFHKIQHEGGIGEALEYGLKADQLDDSNPKLKAAWRTLQEAFKPVDELLEEIGESEGSGESDESEGEEEDEEEEDVDVIDSDGDDE